MSLVSPSQSWLYEVSVEVFFYFLNKIVFYPKKFFLKCGFLSSQSKYPYGGSTAHRWTVVEVTLPEVLQEEPLVLLKGLSPATRYALYVSTISTRSAIVTATTSLFSECLVALPQMLMTCYKLPRRLRRLSDSCFSLEVF